MCIIIFINRAQCLHLCTDIVGMINNMYNVSILFEEVCM